MCIPFFLVSSVYMCLWHQHLNIIKYSSWLEGKSILAGPVPHTGSLYIQSGRKHHTLGFYNASFFFLISQHFSNWDSSHNYSLKNLVTSLRPQLHIKCIECSSLVASGGLISPVQNQTEGTWHPPHLRVRRATDGKRRLCRVLDTRLEEINALLWGDVLSRKRNLY